MLLSQILVALKFLFRNVGVTVQLPLTVIEEAIMESSSRLDDRRLVLAATTTTTTNAMETAKSFLEAFGKLAGDVIKATQMDKALFALLSIMEEYRRNKMDPMGSGPQLILREFERISKGCLTQVGRREGGSGSKY